MDVRSVILLTAFVMFCATIESGTAATVQLPLLVPSPPSATLDKEKQRLEARCPPLDPCKIGDYYMEVFEKIRKGVNCPPQPQRCSTTTPKAMTSATTESSTVVAQPVATTETILKPNNTVLVCQYMEQVLQNKSFLHIYVEVLKSLGCPTQNKSTPASVTVISKVPDTTVASTLTVGTNIKVALAIAKEPNTTVAPTIAKEPNTTVAPTIAKEPNTTVTPAIAKEPGTTVASTTTMVTDSTISSSLVMITKTTAKPKETVRTIMPPIDSQQSFLSKFWEQFLIVNRQDWSTLPQPSNHQTM